MTHQETHLILFKKNNSVWRPYNLADKQGWLVNFFITLRSTKLTIKVSR